MGRPERHDYTVRLAAPETEFSAEFVQQMANRMSVSHLKYGPIADGYPHKVDAVATLQRHLDAYSRTGNREYLIDAANMAMIEFLRPAHPNAHYTPTDSSGSTGRARRDGADPDAANSPVGDLSDEPRIYEILNPHDRYQMRAGSDAVALVAVVLLGEGRYMPHRAGFNPPLAVTGSAALDQYCNTYFGASLTELLDRALGEHPADVAASLRTICIDLEGFEAAGSPGDWHTQRRSSSVDLRAVGDRIAARIDARQAKASA